MSGAAGAVEPDISEITDYLYISAFPEAEHAATIRALNVRLILSMPFQKPHHEVRMPPVKWLHLRTVDSPLTPMPISTLRRGVEAALPVIDGGHAVLVHCLAGVHRSVAMACCILIGMGLQRRGGDGPGGVEARGRRSAGLVHPVAGSRSSSVRGASATRPAAPSRARLPRRRPMGVEPPVERQGVRIERAISSARSFDGAPSMR